jgi:hypothetical protein
VESTFMFLVFGQDLLWVCCQYLPHAWRRGFSFSWNLNKGHLKKLGFGQQIWWRRINGSWTSYLVPFLLAYGSIIVEVKEGAISSCHVNMFHVTRRWQQSRPNSWWLLAHWEFLVFSIASIANCKCCEYFWHSSTWCLNSRKYSIRPIVQSDNKTF